MKVQNQISVTTIGHGQKQIDWPQLRPLTVTESGAFDWRMCYLRFIQEAQVPVSGEGRDGRYDLNKYSEPAMKIFKKALESGVKYEVLVKSTMLYYKTRKQYALKIGNYIEQGAWRSDYEALLSSAEDGTIIEHIKKEIDETTEFSRFKLG